MLFMSCVALVFFMLSCLFITTLWSPGGEGLTSWLLLVMSHCNFVTFLCGILSQVWYWIVLITDLCNFSYSDCLWGFCVGLWFGMHYFMTCLVVQSS